MPEIVIPKGHRTLLAKLVSLPDDQTSALLNELRNTPPALKLSELASRISPPTKLEAEDARSIVGMLASMYEAMSRTDTTPNAFAEGVVSSARELPAGLFPSTVDWAKAENLIAELMKLDQSLGVSSKVLGVITDHDHVYCRSRVLTDVRPVFSSSVSDPPAALVVVHTLRLTYHSGSEMKGFYLALDAADLEELRDQLDRAMEKEKSLRTMMTEKNLPVLSTSEVR